MKTSYKKCGLETCSRLSFVCKELSTVLFGKRNFDYHGYLFIYYLFIYTSFKVDLHITLQ